VDPVAIAKIHAPTRVGSIPTSREPSGFSEAAVIAWPSQLRLDRQLKRHGDRDREKAGVELARVGRPANRRAMPC